MLAVTLFSYGTADLGFISWLKLPHLAGSVCMKHEKRLITIALEEVFETFTNSFEKLSKNQVSENLDEF